MSWSWLHLGAFCGAAAMTLALTPLVAAAGRRVGIVDVPDPRKVHKGLVPRIGGVAIFLGLIIGTLAYGIHFGWARYFGLFSNETHLAMLLPCALVFLVGLMDDLFMLRPVMRLLVEVLAATILMHAAPNDFIIHRIVNPLGEPISLGLLAPPVTLLWFIGVTNAFNLIDGLDGLMAGIASISLIGCAILAGPALGTAAMSLALAGALVGFLFWNWHPARVFAGDAGSLLAGFAVAALALKVSGTNAPVPATSLHVPLLLCAIPAAETFLTLGRRYINNQPFFAPDRSHIHHVLLLRGVSVPRATLVLVLMQVLFVAAAISITRLQGPWVLAPLGVAILTGVLGLRWLNYMELRVLWHRVLHRLLHRRRQKYGHIMALANAGEHLAAVDSTAEVAGRLQAVVDDARLACLCVTLEPDIRAAIPEADRQILETPETSSTARALLNAEPFWMLGNATQEIDERTMERITFTYPLALGERLLGRVAIVRWQEPREVGPTSNDVRRYVADPLTRLLQRLIGADAPDEIESRTDRLDERVVIGAGVKE